jgi:hypothetical protein
MDFRDLGLRRQAHKQAAGKLPRRLFAFCPILLFHSQSTAARTIPKRFLT